MSETTNDGIAVDLDEVLRLAEQATSPPWFNAGEVPIGNRCFFVVDSVADGVVAEAILKPGNADFIAAVRTAFPVAMQKLRAVEAEIARLQRDLDAAIAVMAEHHIPLGELIEKPLMLSAENARLRNQLDRLKTAATAANVALFERWEEGRTISVACELNRTLIELDKP